MNLRSCEKYNQSNGRAINLVQTVVFLLIVVPFKVVKILNLNFAGVSKVFFHFANRKRRLVFIVRVHIKIGVI